MNSESESSEILITRWTKEKDDLEQVLAGTVILKDGKLSFKAEAGHKIAMDSVKEESEGKDPTKWFHSLPRMFDGIALRARLLKKGDRPWKKGGQADVLAGPH